MKTILVRRHIGGLQESMESAEKVDATNQAVADYFNRVLWNFHVNAHDIQVEYYGYDDRIQWDTYVVMDKTGILGYTNGPLE